MFDWQILFDWSCLCSFKETLTSWDSSPQPEVLCWNFGPNSDPSLKLIYAVTETNISRAPLYECLTSFSGFSKTLLSFVSVRMSQSQFSETQSAYLFFLSKFLIKQNHKKVANPHINMNIFDLKIWSIIICFYYQPISFSFSCREHVCCLTLSADTKGESTDLALFFWHFQPNICCNFPVASQYWFFRTSLFQVFISSSNVLSFCGPLGLQERDFLFEVFPTTSTGSC